MDGAGSRGGPDDEDLVWYVAYGSNMSPDRLRCYLEGGRAPGATRTQPGARDRTPPRARRGVHLDGTVYFARESSTWGGGVAFYDPDTPPVGTAGGATGRGGAVGHAHLVTVGQLSDIAHQESQRPPTADVDLGEVLRTGRGDIGPGWYDSLVLTGWADGVAMLTVTSSTGFAAQPTNSPGAAYLTMIVDGLAAAHGWSPERIGAHLAATPGVAGAWTAAAISALARRSTT